MEDFHAWVMAAGICYTFLWIILVICYSFKHQALPSDAVLWLTGVVLPICGLIAAAVYEKLRLGRKVDD